MKIFLSWSGNRSRELARALREWLPLAMHSLEPWMSSHDIQKGMRWDLSLTKELEDSRLGIFCLTPENLDSPWIFFEAGAVFKLQEQSRIFTYLHGLNAADVPPPLSRFQATQATRDDTFQLFTAINGLLESPMPERNAQLTFNQWWPDLERRIRSLPSAREYPVDIERARGAMVHALNQVMPSKVLETNQYFRELVAGIVTDDADRLQDILRRPARIGFPHVLYPQHLVALLRKFKVTVKAVSLVDREQYFWRGKQGDEILKHTTAESSRVFVFHSAGYMRENLPLLRKHANAYNVGAMSYDNLCRRFPNYKYDFSIIGDPSTRLLARYDEVLTSQLVEFSTDRREISQHEDVLTEIIASAIEVASFPQDEDALVERTFAAAELGHGLTVLDRRTVEMSAYIPIHDYDLHEEAHAYVVDMMNSMVGIIEGSREGRSRIRILELGAGTGIFTKRLMQLENVDIVILEIDWACYKVLEHKVSTLEAGARRRGTTVSCLSSDNRTYRSDTKFDIVCSSFADHHIKPYDKRRYLENLKLNLAPGGIILTGDEFLPRYELDDVEARRVALKKYHDHIIDLADRAGETVLVYLEQASLKSGLEEIGDFKLSCEEYEAMVVEAGLRYEKHKVGPLDNDEVGGVYVYRIEVRK